MPYIGRSLADGVRARYIYSATSGQTSFSGNDVNSIALAYSDTLYMDVYQNGVLLKPVTDYASTTGTSVVLVTGASASDVVEMIVYDSFAVADTVSAANGGSFGGAVSMSDDLNVDSGTLFVDASTNRVGIGTVSPAAPLNITGASAGGNYPALITNTATDGYSTLQLLDANAGIYRAGTAVSAYGGASSLNILTVQGHSVTIGTSNTVRVNVSGDGEVTMPAQPCFQAKSSTIASNLAISQALTIAFGTEVIDKGGNFASNTFTAPVTGSYFLGLKINLQTLDSAAGYYRLGLITSNRVYYFYLDPDFGQDAALFTFQIAMVADMDASDTAYGQFYQSGGTAQTDLRGGECQFFGYLIA